MLKVTLKAATRIESLNELIDDRRTAHRDKQPPKGRHRCLSCLCSFEYLENLEYHLARRTIMLVCCCSPCRTWHVFLNPCTLKAHVGAFSVKPDTLVAKVFKLPLYPKKLSISRIIHLYDQPEGNLLSTLLERCPVCNTHVANTAQHLQNAEAGRGWWCILCVKLFPTPCMLILHHKAYHASSENVMVVHCPECGKGLPDRARLQAHAVEECMHLYRSHVYRCRQGPPGFLPCGKVCRSTKKLAEHYAVHHSTPLMKHSVRQPLTTAKLHAVNEPAARKQQVSHPRKLMFEQKCPFCDHYSETETLIGHIMLSHKDEMFNASSVSKFACPYMCVMGGIWFDSSWELRMHMIYDHGGTKTQPEKTRAAAPTVAKRRTPSEKEDESEKKKQRLAADTLLLLAGVQSDGCVWVESGNDSG